MADRTDYGAGQAHVGIAVAAYLVFAISAAFSVRPDGSTRWPALAVGLLAMAVVAVSMLAGARRGPGGG
jgi:hypothetical protein